MQLWLMACSTWAARRCCEPVHARPRLTEPLYLSMPQGLAFIRVAKAGLAFVTGASGSGFVIRKLDQDRFGYEPHMVQRHTADWRMSGRTMLGQIAQAKREPHQPSRVWRTQCTRSRAASHTLPPRCPTPIRSNTRWSAPVRAAGCGMCAPPPCPPSAGFLLRARGCNRLIHEVD